MSESAFDPKNQEKKLANKIVAGFERISEVFRILLWEKAKLVGLSPIQIQILIFIAHHRPELCNVSHLAREFNLTKPTISDAIKVLDKKELIVKDFSASDSRSYTIHLSTQGKDVLSVSQDFASPLTAEVGKFSEAEQQRVFSLLSELIYSLNQKEILTVQRICFGCTFYEERGNLGYCKLLEKDLKGNLIRIDCPEFISRS